MDQKAVHLVGEQPRMHPCTIKATYPTGIPGPLLQSLGYPNKPGVVTRHQALGLWKKEAIPRPKTSKMVSRTQL